MNKLFSIAYRRVLSSLSVQQLSPATISQTLTNRSINPIGASLFFRLPRQELKAFFNTPCPVNSTTTSNDSIIIQSSKSLRSSLSIKESSVCNKCPFKDSCPHYLKEGTPSEANSLSNLLIFMNSMNERSELNQDKGFKVWTGGYKMSDSLIATLQDLKNGGQQTREYERLRVEYTEQKLKEQAEANTQFEKGRQDKNNSRSVANPAEISDKISNLYKERNQQLKKKQYQLFAKQQVQYRSERYSQRSGREEKGERQQNRRDRNYDKQSYEPKQMRQRKQRKEDYRQNYRNKDTYDGNGERRRSYEDRGQFNRKPRQYNGEGNDKPRYDRQNRSGWQDRQDRPDRQDRQIEQRHSKYQRQPREQRGTRSQRSYERDERKQNRDFENRPPKNYENSAKRYKQKFSDQVLDFDFDDKFENEGQKYSKRSNNFDRKGRENIPQQQSEFSKSTNKNMEGKSEQTEEASSERRGRRVRR